MDPNPSLGVAIITMGGLAGAVFYIPFKKVKGWAWESYWMVYAIVGLVVAPWLLTYFTSPNVLGVIRQTPGRELIYCCLCGAAWGIGGLTWGLMIRYLGVGLGLAIGCGLCSAAGTLVPKVLKGELMQLFESSAGITSFVGVVVSLAGIVLVGLAGMSKESELSEEVKKRAVAEYNFKKGMIVAVFSGLMSSAMNFGLQGGGTLENLAQTVEPVTAPIWRGMPVLVVVLFGGFLTNFLYCLYLNVTNKTLGDYTKTNVPLVGNLVFAGLAGAIWCSQFVCQKTGEPALGMMKYLSWAVLMASAILFSTLLGILLGEWNGTSKRTRTRLAAGLVLLIVSAILAGYSGSLEVGSTAV
ncbi:MAG: rhamnose/proton symporter RhaT [Phycisphaerales bacterium]|nr:rhamnose/proton symporter RhaT [Phycisphaerales bacterium]